MTEEHFKGCWHEALGLIFGTTAAYNVMRFAVTRSRRHALHVAIHGSLMLYELRLARSHWARCAR